MRLLACFLVGVVALVGSSSVRAEDRVDWVRSLRDGFAIAKSEGKPLFVAMHEPGGSKSDAWPASATLWAALYRDVRVVSELKHFVCVQQIRSPALLRGFAPRTATKGSPYLMVLDGSQRALALQDHWTPEKGKPSIDALVTFLRAARSRYEEPHGGETRAVPKAGDETPPAGAPKKPLSRAGSVLRPTPLPLGSPALRMHLRWGLPAPRMRRSGDSGDALATARRVGVDMYWDDRGPIALEPLTLTPGKEIKHTLDVRLDKMERLKPYLTKGKHSITVFLRALPGEPLLADARVPVARVWVSLGEGGGGGGGQNDPAPDEENEGEDDAKKPVPEKEKETPPQVDPEEERQEVVDPFVRNDDTVKKDDALVAVEDEHAGVKPPDPTITEEQLRQFDAMRTAALRDGRISKAEATFLARYFAALSKRARTKKPATDNETR